MSQNVAKIDVAAIIERIKSAKGMKTDMDVAHFLGMSTQSGALSKAVARGRLNLQRVIEACHDVNQDWLLWGRGSMKPDSIEPGSELEVEDTIRGVRKQPLTFDEFVDILRERIGEKEGTTPRNNR